MFVEPVVRLRRMNSMADAPYLMALALLLKANWISGGETASLLNSLDELAIRAWRITIAKYEPVSFIAWP